MTKHTVLAKKRRGPAPTGKGTQVVVRMQPPALANLDRWIARQAEAPTRPEAIRRLVEIALAATPVPRVEFRRAKTGRALRNVEQNLDDALGNTFPASDPVEMEEPVRLGRPRTPKPRRKR